MSTNELLRPAHEASLPVREIGADPEQLHADFKAIVGDIESAYGALAPEQKEALQATPAGRKVGGDESNQQTW